MKNQQLNAKVKEYIMSNIIDIETAQNEYNTTLVTDKDRINFVVKEFESTANYPNNLRNFPNQQNRFADWLQGLPGVISIDFMNHEILEIAVNWGSIPAQYTNKQADKILSNWWNFISAKFWQLHRKLNK